MILDLKQLVKKYNLKINGVIHIGAHNGGEYPIYKDLGIENMMFFEPNPRIFAELKNKVGDLAYNYALGNFNGTTTLNIATNNQSSTLLIPKLHLEQYPHIKFNDKAEVEVRKLDSLFYPDYKKFNFINIDAEGYELEVFRGAYLTLHTIDYIYTEVNKAELRKNNAMIWEVDDFLAGFGFKRVEVNWAGGTWGDAFYIK